MLLKLGSWSSAAIQLLTQDVPASDDRVHHDQVTHTVGDRDRDEEGCGSCIHDVEGVHSSQSSQRAAMRSRPDERVTGPLLSLWYVA